MSRRIDARKRNTDSSGRQSIDAAPAAGTGDVEYLDSDEQERVIDELRADAVRQASLWRSLFGGLCLLLSSFPVLLLLNQVGMRSLLGFVTSDSHSPVHKAAPALSAQRTPIY